MAFALRRSPSLMAKHEAYPYQLDAVRAVKDLEYAAVFHEQGLGKTKIAMDLILLWLQEDSVDTVFVVTKKTLVPNWVAEIRTHSFLTPHVLSSNRRQNSIALNSPVLLYVLNYEVVLANTDLMSDFLRTCRVAAILDESQKIKNPASRLAECFHTLAAGFERRLIMTGTPAANRPFDVWSQVKFLDGGHALGNSFQEFKDAFDIPSRLASTSRYATRLRDVFGRINHFTVRETKRTAGLALPDKTIRSHPVTLHARQSEIYAAYRDRLAYELREEGRIVAVDDAGDVLKRLLRLVQCASNPRLVDPAYDEVPAKLARLTTLLGEIDLSSTKVIVWTGFVDNVLWLADRFRLYGAAMVHGRLPVADRTAALTRFKNDDRCRILVATPGAAKEGLTLTVANHAIFFDRSFSLDDYLQAQDRIHRISQSRRCYVHNLIATDTIDEWVDSLLHVKYQAARLMHGDTSTDDFEAAFDFDLSEALAAILSTPQFNRTRRETTPQGLGE